MRSFFSLVPRNTRRCSNDTKLEIHGASAHEFLAALERSQLVLIALAATFTALTIAIAGAQLVYVYRRVSSEKRRNKLYFLATLLPASCRDRRGDEADDRNFRSRRFYVSLAWCRRAQLAFA